MRVIRRICDACTASEQRWIVRIILKGTFPAFSPFYALTNPYVAQTYRSK